MADKDDNWTEHEIERTVAHGGHVVLNLYAVEYTNPPYPGVDRQGVGRSRRGTYCFAKLSEVTNLVDDVRGDLPDTDGTPVAYVGSHLGKNYWKSHDMSNLFPALAAELRDADLTLVDGVDGGWCKWEGRPEWSDNYVDFRDAEPVDLVEEFNLDVDDQEAEAHA